MIKEKDQLVVFKVRSGVYGVSISEVKEIIKKVEVCKIPQMPSYMSGVVNLRGKITSIYDLGERFELGSKEYNEDAKILVMNDSNVGIIVDEVNEIIQISREDVDSGTCLTSDYNNRIIEGFVKSNDKVITLLNFKNIKENLHNEEDKVN
jgi:purine-binding chemotaxis protein CheW